VATTDGLIVKNFTLKIILTINCKSPFNYRTSLLCCSNNKQKMAKCKTISRLSEHFGFKDRSDGTVSSGENLLHARMNE